MIPGDKYLWTLPMFHANGWTFTWTVTAAGGTRPRVVFTSSVASFSTNQNTVLADNTRQIPGNSYGAQKAAAELILADASRRGFLDVVSIRLPTVIVRPGRPNKAARRRIRRRRTRQASRVKRRQPPRRRSRRRYLPGTAHA